MQIIMLPIYHHEDDDYHRISGEMTSGYPIIRYVHFASSSWERRQSDKRYLDIG